MIRKYWVISHDADTCETGFPTRRTYVRTQWEGFIAQQACELEILRDWCRERFGEEVVYVQGVAPTLNWIIRESTQKEFIEALPINWGGFATHTRRVVLGIGKRGTINVYKDSTTNPKV